MKYTQEYQVHFDDCDPAGIMFFANVWDICHRSYEKWLLNLKNDWPFWFQNPAWIIPIVSSKCDFHRPLLPGTTIQIELSVEKIGSTSFTTHFQLKSNNHLACDCFISHVFADKINFQKREIPLEIKNLLLPFVETQELKNEGP